ncbi:MAG: hypothetical protein KDK70_24655 [Myxococcales bacterium]|nr:hypothetical protein [Myxococcales bacterium]
MKHTLLVLLMAVTTACSELPPLDSTTADEGSDTSLPTTSDPSTATIGGPTTGSGPGSSSSEGSTVDPSHGGTTEGETTEGGTTTGGETTEGETTDTDGTTGGDPPDAGCEASCMAGCAQTLLTTISGGPELGHSAVARFALDENGRLMLWSMPGDEIVAILEGVEFAELDDAVLGTLSGGIVTLRAASDASTLGTVDVTGADWGLAHDGSYLWAVDGTGLRLFEIDGTLRWELLGDYFDARVLALTNAVHVHAPSQGAQVQHIDAMTAVAEAVFFDPATTFGGWFYDSPRFWTLQSPTYRLYEPDGTQIAFELGAAPIHGYGDWVVRVGGGVAAVTNPTMTIVSTSSPRIYGAAVFGAGYRAYDTELIRLDQPVLSEELIALPCCVPWNTNGGDFAYASGHWIISGHEGQVYDDDLDALAPGELVWVNGSASGRLLVSTGIGRTFTWDVSVACGLTDLGTFEFSGPNTALSGDGNTLAGGHRIGNQLAVGLYDVPSGNLIDAHVIGTSGSSMRGMQISDAGGLVGSLSSNTGVYDALIHAYPGWVHWTGTSTVAVPSISPDGTLAIVNHAATQVINATFQGTNSTVHDAAGLVGIFDGVIHGFVDDSSLLVSHYQFVGGAGCFQPGQCDALVGTDITDLTGTPIAAAPIPDPMGFRRVSSTEVFLPSPPAIYEIYTGMLLWSGAEGHAAPVGPDHVAHTVDGSIVLTKWR